MKLIKPPALRSGDTIGIVAPSSYIESDILGAGVEVLKERGFSVALHPQSLARDRQSAGTVSEKVAALHEIYIDDTVKCIIGAGGGNRAAHILHSLDYGLIKSHPKLYMGFSDSTALLSAVVSKAGITCVHGPLIKSLPKLPDPCISHALDLMMGKTLDIPLGQSRALAQGSCDGYAFGGTLSVLSALVGTGFIPDLSGAILFLEDTNEELSRIDRCLWQLKQSLPFNSLSGIVFGEFTNSQDTGRPFGFSLEEILLEHTGDLGIPVLYGVPFGHTDFNYAFPIGSRMKMSVSSSGTSSLSMLEPVVSV